MNISLLGLLLGALLFVMALSSPIILQLQRESEAFLAILEAAFSPGLPLNAAVSSPSPPALFLSLGSRQCRQYVAKEPMSTSWRRSRILVRGGTGAIRLLFPLIRSGIPLEVQLSQY